MTLLDLKQELDPRRLLPSLTAGTIGAVVTISTVISLAALIFSGELSPFLPAGIGLMLFGAFVIGLVVALASSLPVMVGMPQDTPAAILGLVGAGIAVTLRSAAPESVYATVLAAIALASLVSGGAFFVIGAFRWSAFVRYIPYPVVGGFLAGTGWLLAAGALGVMVGRSIGVRDLPSIFGAADLAHWLPGVLFGALLLVVLRRFSHFLITPVALILATAGFYAWLAVAGVSVPQAFAGGWLLGPFPEGGLYRPLGPDALARVEWPAILGQLDKIGTIVVLGVVSLLLNSSALEVIARRDLDLDRELRAAGVANLVGGLGCSSPGYQALGVSSLAHRLGARSRLVGILTALLCGAALFFGAALISYAPKPVLGGVLFLLGLSFLVEWLWDARRKLPAIDYLLVWVIVAVIATVGFLEGIGAGILIATILFVISYSRIDAIKNALSGAVHHSKVERPLRHRRLLQERGGRITILRLQGFLFFGTIQRILDHVRERLADQRQPLEHLVIDLRRVTRMDSSAVFCTERLRQLASTGGFRMVWTDVDPSIRRQLERGSLLVEGDDTFLIRPTLDHGLEECENRLIASHDDQGLEGSVERIEDQLERAFHGRDAAQRVLRYLQRREVREGECLVRQGDAAEEMYFVEDGLIAIQLEREGAAPIRLRSLRSGTTVGEMGLYLASSRTASAVAARPSTVYRLTARALETMERDDPEVAALLHRWMASLLAERVAASNLAVEALLD
jgi:SulP family sulfate permease